MRNGAHGNRCPEKSLDTVPLRNVISKIGGVIESLAEV
jgi:hypothetical protein